MPRTEIELLPAQDDCAACGGRLRQLGEDVTEELEYVPGRLVVNRITRPRFAGQLPYDDGIEPGCSSCNNGDGEISSSGSYTPLDEQTS